mgnify:CR=1 FL=1
MKRILLLLTIVFSLNATAQVTVTSNAPITYPALSFSTLYEIGELEGTLTSVTINASLTASAGTTYANDLTFYLATTLAAGGPLQIGGFSSLNATQRLNWANGGSSTAGTIVSGTVVVNPLDISLYNVYLGNGYNATGGSGTWNNLSVTLNGVAEVTASANDFVSSKFSIYPNPANDVLNISNADFQIKQVGITDINGRAIKTIIQSIPSQETTIDVSDLSAGVYFLVINTTEGKAVKKFVKN